MCFSYIHYVRACTPLDLQCTCCANSCCAAMKRRTASAPIKTAAPAAQNAPTTKRVRPVLKKRQSSKEHAAVTTAAGDTATIASAAAAAAVVAPDGLTRCKWAGMYKGAAAVEYVRYHDEEWGRPVHDDKQLFELLTLEGAQAGLSWSTILAKREGYRTAFEGFDPAKVVACFDATRLESLLAEGSGVVRHRGKLESVVQNAKVVLELQRHHGSLDAFLWSFVPNSQPIINSWTAMDQVPTKTAEAESLSKALKKAGMKFVGPTTCYAFMQAAGMVNDHSVDCHCYKHTVDSYSSSSTL